MCIRDRFRTLKINAQPATKGTIIRLAVGGGGGYGRPEERDLDAVRYDVENGYVSVERARADYGYVHPE